MADKKLKIVITRERSRQSDPNPQSAGQIRRGVIPRKKSDDYLKRRKRPAGIQFYDLGYLANGNSIYVSFVPAYSYSSTEDVTLEPFTDEKNTALVAQLQARVFAVASSPGNFGSGFHKINKAEVFEQAINVSFETASGTVGGKLSEIDEEFWTSGAGLKLQQSNLASLRLSGDGWLFESTALDFSALAAAPEAAGFKITNQPSVDAPAAAFAPSLRMDVFLMPALVGNYAKAVYNDGIHIYTDPMGVVHSSSIRKTEHLNNSISTLPRSLYADFQAALGETPGSYQWAYKQIKVFNRLPDARSLRSTEDFYETPPYASYFAWETFSPASMPFPAIYTPTGIDNSGAPVRKHVALGVGGGEIEARLPHLAMIIRKNYQLYYFWRIGINFIRARRGL